MQIIPGDKKTNIESFNFKDDKYTIRMSTKELNTLLGKLGINEKDIKILEKQDDGATFEIVCGLEDAIAKSVKSQVWQGYIKDETGYMQDYNKRKGKEF